MTGKRTKAMIAAAKTLGVPDIGKYLHEKSVDDGLYPWAIAKELFSLGVKSSNGRPLSRQTIDTWLGYCGIEAATGGRIAGGE